MATTCSVCKRSYTEELCPYCTVTDVKVSELTDKLHLQHGGDGAELPTAFLVDLVSNRKIPITAPRCKVGRDDLNDIVISGDQSISRFHFVITKDNDQYMVQDSKSRHGTFLNGNQIAGPIPINDGDVLKVGVSLFWFVIENQAVGSSADQFAPVDIETAEAQEMKVSAGELTTPYAPTKEVDISSMTSLKEVLAQAKAKESASSEAEMSMTIAPKEQMNQQKGNDKTSEKSEDKQEKPGDKGSEKSNDKSDSKDAKDSKDSKESKEKESKDSKDKESKSDSEGKDSKNKKDDKEEKESAKKDEPSEKKDEGMQITASMLMEALEHESLSEVSKLDDAPKDKEKSSDYDKPEEAESKDKDKGKKSKKESDEPSPEDLQGLFSSDNGNLDKTSGDKESNGSNNKDQESSSSDKITDSSADKAPEEKSEDKAELEAKEKAKEKAEEDSKEEPKGNNEDFSPGSSDKEKSDSESVSKSTLDKMADTVQEMSNSDNSESKDKESTSQEENSEPEKQTTSKLEEAETIASQLFEQEIVEKTKNGAWSGNTMQDTKVPDWCSKYFASELNLLVKDLDNLNEQVRTAQNKIKEVENRLAATKSLRNTLLTATGEDLVEACGKVLARLGWRVKIVEDDKQELRLESDDKVSICRIIWTPGLPERTHLGQLSIAQTRFWCEQGAEPKGILIAAQAEDKPPPKITDSDYSGELADYASKKNVLMLTTLQLLAMYKEIALNEGSAESLRSSIHTSNGWLKGYSLDPSDEDEKEPGKLASASI